MQTFRSKVDIWMMLVFASGAVMCLIAASKLIGFGGAVNAVLALIFLLLGVGFSALVDS